MSTTHRRPQEHWRTTKSGKKVMVNKGITWKGIVKKRLGAKDIQALPLKQRLKQIAKEYRELKKE